MTKVVSSILAGPIGLIDKRAGQIISGIGITVLGIATGNPFLVSLGSFQLQQGLAPRPPKPEQTTTSIKSPTPARISGYGRLRLYWAYILFETASDGWAVDVGVFHDGRLDGIETHYLGDKAVTVLSGGWIQKGPAGEWGNNDSVRIGTRLGLPVETAFSEVIAKLPGIWTSNHRGDGCATGFLLSKSVKAENFQTIYAAGGPNQTPLSIVARAQRVFDWRDLTQSVGDPATWKWSENAVLHTVHYRLVREGPRPLLPPNNPGYAAEVSGILTARWARLFAPTVSYATAAANDADIAMPLKAGGTEPRYRSCVAHKHTDAHKDVLAHLLGSFDGWMAPRADGALVIRSGRYYAPTVTIGPDEIISYSLQEGVDEESAVNTLKLTYVSSEHDFNTVDTTDWTDESDVAARGKELAAPLENQVPSHSQARRLGKREIAEVMAPQRGVTNTTAAGRVVLGERYIRQQLIEAGTTFQDAVVQIKKVRRNPQTGGVTYEWILADPNVDAWNPATEEGDPAPTGERVAREPLETPEIVATSSQLDETGTSARISATVVGPSRDDLTWYLRWRVTTDAIWNEQTYTDIDPGPSIELLSSILPVNVSIDIEVAYSEGDGRVSDWSNLVPVSTSTDGLSPGPTTNVSATGGAGSITATWRNPASLNYNFTRCYYGATNVFGAATALTPDDAASPSAVRSQSFTGIPPGTYYVWTRAYSTLGVPALATQASGTITVT